MINKIIFFLFRIINYINYFFLPKKNNLILLYSNLGFRDNVRSMYDYLLKHNYNKRYRIICSLNDYTKYNKQKKENVKFVSNIVGIIYFLKAKYVFYCFGKYPITPSPQQIVIHMWHGMPLKNIGRLESNKKNNKYDYFTEVLSTSEFFKPYMAKAFGCKEDRVLICGQPRTDELFDKIIDIDILRSSGKKYIILWMPTYRQSDGSTEKNGNTENNGLPICNSQKVLSDFDYLLENHKTLCFIKLHPIQKKGLDIEADSLKNIRFIDDETFNNWGISLYQFISLTNALITDYSSVYIDYLLLNRPICFTIDDIDEYSSTRGFINNNPLALMPGKHVVDFSGLEEFLDEISSGKDDFFEARLNALQKFHKYQDNQNTKRLLNYCGIR